MKRTIVEEFDEAGRMRKRVTTEEEDVPQMVPFWYPHYPNTVLHNPLEPPFTITCDPRLNNY